MYEATCRRCAGKTATAQEELPADYLRRLEEVREDVLQRFFNGEDANELLHLTIDTLSQAVSESFASKGDFTQADTVMLMHLQRDVWHFSCAKNWQQMQDLSHALIDKEGNLRSFAQFCEQANAVVDKYNIQWMKAEYNFAVSSSQSAARWVEFQAEADIIPLLRYETVGDSHVRPAHQALNGITRPISDEFWNTHYPPNGWNCRCEVVQAIDGQITPYKQIPKDTPIAPIFKTNLAKKSLVFPPDSNYYNTCTESFDTMVRSVLDRENPEDTFVRVKIGEHSIAISPLQSERELEKNIRSVQKLLNIDPEANIKLMPIIQTDEKHQDINDAIRQKYYPKEYLEKFVNKNADMMYNETVSEIESPVGSKRSIQHAVEHGIKQADVVYIEIPEDVDMDKAYNIVNGQVLAHHRDTTAEIWIFNGTEKRLYKNKKQKRK